MAEQTAQFETRPIDEIKWRKDLYPRLEPNATVIQQYAEDITVLPPIEINQHNELIDGYHRWTAHRKAQAETIAVFVTETTSDRHLAFLAVERNSKHGCQMSSGEKKTFALKWYTGEAAEKETFATMLGVTVRTIRRWLADRDKNLKAARRKRACELWLACWIFGLTLGIWF